MSVALWKIQSKNQIALSTLSFKNERTTEYFQHLTSISHPLIELNLTNFLESGLSADSYAGMIRASKKRILVADGGWCDFFVSGFYEASLEAKQIELLNSLFNPPLRLFFGLGDIKNTPRLISNIQALSDRYPHQTFLFETHDTLSSDYKWLQFVMENIRREKIGLVLDPANIIHHTGNYSLPPENLFKYIGHIHLKGVDSELNFTSYRNSTNTFSETLHIFNSTSTIGIEIEPSSVLSLEELDNSLRFLETEILKR